MKTLKITLANTRLASLLDQISQMRDLGFAREGHVEITFLADTVAPARLYIQRLRHALRAEEIKKENPKNEM